MKYQIQLMKVMATAALIVGASAFVSAVAQSDTNSQQRAVAETRPALAARSAGSSARSEPTTTEGTSSNRPGTGSAATPSLDLAIEKFKQAISVEPTNAPAHFGLGMAYSKSNRYKEASESFKRAVRLRPDWAEAHLRLGQMYYVLDLNGQALSEHKRLLTLNPAMAETLMRTIRNDGKVPSFASATKNVVVVGQPSSMEKVAAGNQTSGVSAPRVNEAPGKTQAPASAVIPRPLVANVIAASSPNAPAAPSVSIVAETKAPNAKTSSDQIASSTYRVGVGDVLDIRLLNSATNKSTLYTVIDGGVIDFPLAGDPMPVAGLTTEEIQSQIGNELKRRGVQENAQLSVGVRDYTSHQVIVTGLVGSPGTKRLRREAVPLYVILAEAQPRPEAARATIIGAKRQLLKLDLSDPANMNVLVRPGDLITISARPQEFYYLGGPVNYPGQKPYQPGITLLQAILAAGGFSKSGDTAEISREGANQRLSTTKYDLKQIKAGKVQDPRLEPGDRVEVLQ